MKTCMAEVGSAHRLSRKTRKQWRQLGSIIKKIRGIGKLLALTTHEEDLYRQQPHEEDLYKTSFLPLQSICIFLLLCPMLHLQLVYYL